MNGAKAQPKDFNDLFHKLIGPVRKCEDTELENNIKWVSALLLVLIIATSGILILYSFFPKTLEFPESARQGTTGALINMALAYGIARWGWPKVSICTLTAGILAGVSFGILNSPSEYTVLGGMEWLVVCSLCASRVFSLRQIISLSIIISAGQFAIFFNLPREFQPLAIYQTIFVGSISSVAIAMANLRRKFEHEGEVQRLQTVESARLTSLGMMASGIAHEVNNPLTIISGKADLLLHRLETGRADTSEIKRELDRILSTSQRITRIIRSLRSISRNAEKDEPVPTRVSSVIEDTLELCRQKFSTSDLEFRTSYDPEIEIYCRSAQISQVLVNLLNNSFDAVSELNEKWISINTKLNKDFVFLEVTDSGKGIPNHLAERIMDPFFTTKEVGRGTGLGLSISKGIIENHNGKFFYDSSSPNTKFVIALPNKTKAIDYPNGFHQAQQLNENA